MGAGGFGTALAFILSRNGHQVELWDYETDLIEHWRELGHSDRYPFFEPHQFPENLKLVTHQKIQADNYDFVVAASSLAGLLPTLKRINFGFKRTPLVLIQKGMFPGLKPALDAVHEINPKAIVLQFTGAAFAKDMVSKTPVGMIISYQEQDLKAAQNYAALFKGSNIWPTLCTDMLGINIHNTLRTIASFEQGFVYGYFSKENNGKEPPISTIAITFSAISQEIKQIAQLLGATKEIHDIESKVFRIIEADLMLCQSDSSRNFALGHFMGLGSNLEKAKTQVTEGVSECIPNVKTVIDAFFERKLDGDIEHKFPYLRAANRLLYSGDEIDDCMKDILAHHENYAV